MVNLFGFGQPKCERCGMNLSGQIYEWRDKKFCCKSCKKEFRHKKSKGGSSCH